MPAVSEDYPRLLSLAAHELRTPVSVVAGYIRMLQKDGDILPDRHRRILDEAAKSCERLAAIVNELSDVGKLDAGVTTVAKERFDVFPLVVEAVDAARQSPQGDTPIAITGDESGAEIQGDRTRLRSALSTLVRTVLREQSAAIVVQRQLIAAPEGRMALVVVAPAAHADHADTAPRARLDEGRGGLGLSLPIARRIVERHGGEIWSPAGDSGQAARGAILVRLPCHAPCL